jgi:signal peptidase I
METNAQIARLPWWVVIVVGRRPKRTMVRAAFLIAAAVIVFKFILLPIRVQGISMVPTYKNGGVNFVNRLAFLWHEPQRGDVVAIRYAGENVMLMKRVVGLPGETVAFEGGRLVIDGHVMYEPYVKLPCSWEVETKTMRPNEYYVVGDNRSMAPLDHEKGGAARERIVGKVLL